MDLRTHLSSSLSSLTQLTKLMLSADWTTVDKDVQLPPSLRALAFDGDSYHGMPPQVSTPTGWVGRRMPVYACCSRCPADVFFSCCFARSATTASVVPTVLAAAVNPDGVGHLGFWAECKLFPRPGRMLRSNDTAHISGAWRNPELS